MIDTAPLIAAVLSLALGGISLLWPPRRLRHATFAAGMVAFALESAVVYALLEHASTPETHARWMTALESASLLPPIAWCLFAFRASRHAAAPPPPGWPS